MSTQQPPASPTRPTGPDQVSARAADDVAESPPSRSERLPRDRKGRVLFDVHPDILASSAVPRRL